MTCLESEIHVRLRTLYQGHWATYYPCIAFVFFCSSVYCYVKTECGSELSAGIRGALSHVKKKRRDAALAAHRALSLLEIEVEAGWSGPRRSCLAWLLFGRRGVWISPGTRRRDSGQRRAPSAAPICPCVIRTSGTQPLPTGASWPAGTAGSTREVRARPESHGRLLSRPLPLTWLSDWTRVGHVHE